MTSSRKQLYFMAFILSSFGAAYCLRQWFNPFLLAVLLGTLFPAQMVLWRLNFSRKAKDFCFCFSLVIVALLLKDEFTYFDFLFYLLAIICAAALRYRTFIALSLSCFVLEMLREWFRGMERPEEVITRHALFFLAGTLTYFLLREEKRQKLEFKRELDDLKYGINQMESEPVAEISESEKTSRKVDAAIALDESLKNALSLIHGIFKPETTLMWQYIPEKQQLRVRNEIGNTAELKQGMVVNLGEGPVGWTALNRKPYFQQDREEGIEFSFYRKNATIRSLIGVPIIDGERLEGILTIDSPYVKAFASDAESAMVSFANQIAEMIRMARLAREREERAFEFQAFYHASKQLSSIIDFEEIVRKLHLLCGEIVHCDFTAIAVPQKEGATYSLYEWSNQNEEPVVREEQPNDARTWISWFLQSREEPLIVSEAQIKLQDMPILRMEEKLHDFSTFLAVPMRHQQSCIGAVLVASEKKDAFSSHQAHILSILCNQAAVSLENSSIIKKMEQLAITDGLTHLFNHRYFQEALDRELERASRQQVPLTLMLMDIDHFKGFNDSFGHPAGDFILRSLAALLKTNARKIDILARYGGEEFAAILPGIDLKNARKTAERWRKAVQRASFKWNKQSFAITVSIGIALFPEDATTKSDLIERTDRALYDAKENGRNQVKHASDGAETRSRLFG